MSFCKFVDILQIITLLNYVSVVIFPLALFLSHTNIRYVCGMRIKLTIDNLLKDRSGRFASLVAALDAGLCDSNARHARDRQAANSLLTECVVKMNAVSHGEFVDQYLSSRFFSSNYHISLYTLCGIY